MTKKDPWIGSGESRKSSNLRAFKSYTHSLDSEPSTPTIYPQSLCWASKQRKAVFAWKGRLRESRALPCEQRCRRQLRRGSPRGLSKAQLKKYAQLSVPGSQPEVRRSCFGFGFEQSHSLTKDPLLFPMKARLFEGAPSKGVSP